jgi:hypothetical protein
MSVISFDQLYGDDKNLALGVFLIWANDFLDGFDAPGRVNISISDASEYVSNLRKSDFPACGGFEKASPFKKAASAYVWLHALDPFKQPLPEEMIGHELYKFSSSTASLIGFALVKSCLHGVTITRADQSIITLANPIQVSRHFMVDLVEASNQMTPQTHFKVYSLLFEALAYEANADICYPKVF